MEKVTKKALWTYMYFDKGLNIKRPAYIYKRNQTYAYLMIYLTHTLISG